MTQFHFIAGLPRSGTTLLAALLRQNPAIHAGISSPVGGIFNVMQRAVSGSNEAAIWLSEKQRERHLRAVFTAHYADVGFRCQECGEGPAVDVHPSKDHVVFDTNRMWPSKLPTLVRLFPSCRIICCVRHLAWVVDSMERLIRRNPLELSGIFGYEPGGTVYSRVAGLTASTGLVGFALDALREGFYGEHADRMLLVEYQALANHPRDTLGAIYEWMKLPMYRDHQFDAVAQIPGAVEFDARLGTPGLHHVASRVRWEPRETILPPEMFASFPAPFWRANNPKVPVIHCEGS